MALVTAPVFTVNQYPRLLFAAIWAKCSGTPSFIRFRSLVLGFFHCFQMYIRILRRSHASHFSLGLFCPHKELWLRLTSARSAPLSYLAAVTPFGALHADLPGYHTFLSLHLSAALITHDSCSYWTSACIAVFPLMRDLLCDSVPQARGLPVVYLLPHPASFRFRLTTDTLAFDDLLPATGWIRVFLPFETCAAGPTTKNERRINRGVRI